MPPEMPPKKRLRILPLKDTYLNIPFKYSWGGIFRGMFRGIL